MLGYLHFVLPYTTERDIVVAFNQDTKTIWFNLDTMFADPTGITFKNGDYRRMVVEDSEDQQALVPSVYLDSTATLEAILSIEDKELHDWVVDVCEYYQHEDMDWSTFKQSIEA